MDVREILSFIGEHILKIAAVFVAVPVIFGPGRWAFDWYVDRYKRQNRAWHEFLIREIYEKSFIPYFIIESKALNCTFTNHALRRLFVSGDEGFEGTNWFRFIEPKELADVVRSWREAFTNRSNYTNEVKIVLHDGTKLRILITAEPFIYAGQARAYIGTVRVLR